MHPRTYVVFALMLIGASPVSAKPAKRMTVAQASAEIRRTTSRDIYPMLNLDDSNDYKQLFRLIVLFKRLIGDMGQAMSAAQEIGLHVQQNGPNCERMLARPILDPVGRVTNLPGVLADMKELTLRRGNDATSATLIMRRSFIGEFGTRNGSLIAAADLSEFVTKEGRDLIERLDLLEHPGRPLPQQQRPDGGQ